MTILSHDAMNVHSQVGGEGFLDRPLKLLSLDRALYPAVAQGNKRSHAPRLENT